MLNMVHQALERHCSQYVWKKMKRHPISRGEVIMFHIVSAAEFKLRKARRSKFIRFVNDAVKTAKIRSMEK